MNISGAGNAAYFPVAQASSAAATGAVARCHGGDDGGLEKQRAGGTRGFGNLLNSVFQALAQTAATPASPPAPTTATTATTETTATADAPATGDAAGVAATPVTGGTDQTQDILQKVATFMQNLFAAMGHNGGHGYGHDDHGRGHHHGHGHDEPSATVAAPVAGTPAATAAPATIPAASTATPPVASTATTSPVRHYQQHEHRGGLVSRVQSLLQQVTSAGTAGEATGPLADLNTSFQNLFNALHPAGAEGAATPPTLQDFLQKLTQTITGSRAATGASTGNLINTAA